jgi:chaperonin GroES|uniref:Co-chaperonin GroES n=1 Tax=uncultured virus TaxID=340016 RepID=A0A221S3P3_9VIRU|nr:co-chaperonin GroES [uncultured virus]
MTEAQKLDLSGVSEGVANLAEAYIDVTDKALDPEKIGGSLLERMPDPTGWRLLILPYRGKGKTDGGIYLPDAVVQEQTISTQVGYVLKVGALAYKDAEKFPVGPWCKQGDWVMFARYAGSRFKIDGGEVRILNDDEVLAKIQEPEDILHF